MCVEHLRRYTTQEDGRGGIGNEKENILDEINMHFLDFIFDRIEELKIGLKRNGEVEHFRLVTPQNVRSKQDDLVPEGAH